MTNDATLSRTLISEVQPPLIAEKPSKRILEARSHVTTYGNQNRYQWGNLNVVDLRKRIRKIENACSSAKIRAEWASNLKSGNQFLHPSFL